VRKEGYRTVAGGGRGAKGGCRWDSDLRFPRADTTQGEERQELLA
jgi:hypothetical protein